MLTIAAIFNLGTFSEDTIKNEYLEIRVVGVIIFIFILLDASKSL